MSTKNRGIFAGTDGRGLFFIACLVSCLFLLWGFCSGLLDNLHKHFQSSIYRWKYQSGFVRNAFDMGYFLIALPAGVLARRFGCRGSTVAGLTLAALGAFWFIPAVSKTPLMGLTADYGGMRPGFIILLLCFAFIAFHGMIWRKPDDTCGSAPVAVPILAH